MRSQGSRALGKDKNQGTISQIERILEQHLEIDTLSSPPFLQGIPEAAAAIAELMGLSGTHPCWVNAALAATEQGVVPKIEERLDRIEAEIADLKNGQRINRELGITAFNAGARS